MAKLTPLRPLPDPRQPFGHLEGGPEGHWYVIQLVHAGDEDQAMEMMRVPARLVEECPEPMDAARDLARRLAIKLIELAAAEAGIEHEGIRVTMTPMAPGPEKEQ
jgi:hypothetical protein